MSSIENLTQDNFEAATSGDTPALVDFWAPWCGPCKAIAPILEELAKDASDKLKIYKVNVDESNELAAKHGVSSIPTLHLFKGGSLVASSVGMVGSKDELLKKFAEHL